MPLGLISADGCLKLIDLIHRVQLGEPGDGLLLQPLVLPRLRQLAPEKPRRGPLAAPGEHGRRHRTKPPGRARHRGRPLEGRGSCAIVVKLPVLDKADILLVLPLVRPGRQPLLQKLDREIGPSGTSRIRLREKDRAEPVRDIEQRIQRRCAIQQRVELAKRFLVL